MLKKHLLYCLFFLNLFSGVAVHAQQQIVQGTVTDEQGEKLANVNVKIQTTAYGTATDKDGSYIFASRYVKDGKLIFSKIGYTSRTIPISFTSTRDTLRVNTQLKLDINQIEEIVVQERRNQEGNLLYLQPKHIRRMPTVTGGVESLIKMQATGVYSTNELSSQYSVRGGNFDENLVYINGIEVYRPFLIRTGEQEGLSIINPDLVESVYFSAGGFNPEYGDKMSSVLDIHYKKPRKFAGSISGGLLGGSAHLENRMLGGKLTQISGIRYKNSSYILNSLETTGDYRPRYIDFQTYWSYKPNSKMEFNALSIISQNQFNFKPQDQSTNFGTRQNPLRLYIDFEGQEQDVYNTFMQNFQFSYRPSQKLKLDFLASAFYTQEKETFDIAGAYMLSAIDEEKQAGEEDLKNLIGSLGIGQFIDHGRNQLQAQVANIQHKGKYITDNTTWEWGLKAQIENIDDNIHEWEMLDSAGYSLPSRNDLGKPRTANQVNLSNVIISELSLSSQRYNAFLQNTYSFLAGNNALTLISGLRTAYWSYSKEFLVSPRANVSLTPLNFPQAKFRLSSGIYNQQAFYRELRNIDGKIYKQQKAQRSIHLILGGDYKFRLWDRPFVLSTELYYKHMNNLIPFEIDNLRIRYFADQISKGFATGIEFKINGEFVKGTDSWLSLSLMNTQEDIEGDNAGYIPRPTNQLFQVAAFFQDYFPNNDTWKIHLAGNYASGLPYGPPETSRKNADKTLPNYKRVDIGLSKKIAHSSGKKVFGAFKSIWLSAEVFNLLGINNTVSYLWIRVVPNTADLTHRYEQYGVPNRLTGRRLNFKFTANF